MAAMRRWSLQRQHEIQMHDSSIDIPLDSRARLLQPLLTTKPSGVRTGPELLITYDIESVPQIGRRFAAPTYAAASR